MIIGWNVPEQFCMPSLLSRVSLEREESESKESSLDWIVLLNLW